MSCQLHVRSARSVAMLGLAAALAIPVSGWAADAGPQKSTLFVTMQREKDALQQQVQELNKQIATHEKRVAALQAQLQQAQRDNAALAAKLTAADQKASGLQGEVDRSQQKADKLIAIVAGLRSLISSQADALNAQKERTSDLAVQTQKLQSEATAAKDKASHADLRLNAAKEQLGRTLDQLRDQEENMHYNLGVVYDQSRDYRQAESEYLKCLALNPNDADANFNLGILYNDKLTNDQKALVHYRRFLKVHPTGRDADLVRGWIKQITGKK